MLTKIIKQLMCCHKPKFLAYVVAIMHLVVTIIVTISFMCHFTNAVDKEMCKNAAFDIPISVVRYMIILFILILITSVLLILGIAMNRPLFIAAFMLSMGIFVITFGIFAISDVLDGIIDGTAFDEIILEFMNDSTILVVDLLMMFPIYLVFVDITQAREASYNRKYLRYANTGHNVLI